MTMDKDALLREARAMILAHVDLNCCLAPERKLMVDIDAALAEPQGEHHGPFDDPKTAALAEPQGVVVPVEILKSIRGWLALVFDQDINISKQQYRPQIESDISRIDALLAAAKEPINQLPLLPKE